MVAIRIRGILAALVVSKMMNNPDEARRVGRRRELPLSTQVVWKPDGITMRRVTPTPAARLTAFAAITTPTRR